MPASSRMTRARAPCSSQGRPRAASRRSRWRSPNRFGGIVINADSMQVYRDLRIITARPTPDEEARVPHRLYGHVDAAENYSVGRWCADARAALAEARGSGRLPIFVGGTGLYFKALTQGLAAVPPIPADVRAAVRARLGAKASRRCMPSCAARSGIGGTADAAATARASRARSRCSRPPAARSPTGIATACRRCSIAASATASSSSMPTAPSSIAASTRRFDAHAGGRRARRGRGRSLRASSIRRCRP